MYTFRFSHLLGLYLTSVSRGILLNSIESLVVFQSTGVNRNSESTVRSIVSILLQTNRRDLRGNENRQMFELSICSNEMSQEQSARIYSQPRLQSSIACVQTLNVLDMLGHWN